ncbi:MAG TPA: hypothetical protein VN668_06160 [Stellaceae bacterium]|nr:hypothetical protein [Stellaceae bacterium]
MGGARLGAAIVCLLLLLCGCQAPSEGWTKPGASAADLTRDLADCERVGTGPPPFRFWALSYDYAGARERIARLKSDCMVARGWSRD